MSEWKEERNAHKRARGLGFKRQIKECAGCGHLICRCDDRRRRHEITIRGSSQ